MLKQPAGHAISSSGMLIGGLVLGIFAIKKHFHRMLCLSLFLLGLFMVGLGMKENFIWICSFGFLLFAALPFANTAIDYLVRININKADQGKVWGDHRDYFSAGLCASLCRHGLGRGHSFQALANLLWLAGKFCRKNHRCWRRQRLRSALYPIRYLLSAVGAYLLSRARSVKELEYVSTLDKK